MSNNKCIYELVEEEVKRHRDLWGEQNHPDVQEWNLRKYREDLAEVRELWNIRKEQGTLSWDIIDKEERLEVYTAETDYERKGEIIQSIAVLVSWYDCIERRGRDLK